jgi:hypothetical protein
MEDAPAELSPATSLHAAWGSKRRMKPTWIIRRRKSIAAHVEAVGGRGGERLLAQHRLAEVGGERQRLVGRVREAVITA